MSELAVIIPVVLQTPELLEQFRVNLRTFQHRSIRQFVIICNRLSIMDPQALAKILAAEVLADVLVLHEKERSVAGAWNRGIEAAEKAGIGLYLITAVDVAVDSLSIESLLRFDASHPECDLWSATPRHEKVVSNGSISVEGCDFSCFMLRYQTICRHGWFDKEFVPAYYEDNDYLTRLVLANASPQRLLDARHNHHGSLTIRMDGEVAHRVNLALENNRLRFERKWGTKSDDFNVIRTACFPSPYNSGNPLHWWPEQDIEGYSPMGGINE